MPLLLFLPLLVLALLALWAVLLPSVPLLLLSAWVTSHWYESAVIETFATIISAPSSTKNVSGERDPEMHQTRKRFLN